MKKVLILKTSSMGDLIHTLPALSDSASQIPNIKFTWVTEEAFQDIPSWHPAVHRIIPIALRRLKKKALYLSSWQALRTFKTQLIDTTYHHVIDAQGLLKSAIPTYLSNGPNWGYDRHSARDPIASLFYQHHVSVHKDLHAITRTRQLFSLALGYPMSITENTPNYGINTKNLPATPKDFKLPTTPDRCLISIHMTSKTTKCWPITFWIKLLHQATDNGYHILYPWGNEEEKKRAQYIAAKHAHAHVLPALTLGQFASLYNQISGAVGLDTGLSHLAAALSLPMVSLYGPTLAERIGAFGRHQIHLQENRLDKIPPEKVWKQLQSLLQKVKHESP